LSFLLSLRCTSISQILCAAQKNVPSKIKLGAVEQASQVAEKVDPNQSHVAQAEACATETIRPRHRRSRRRFRIAATLRCDILWFFRIAHPPFLKGERSLLESDSRLA
jgi:hypothetical protein